VRYGNVIGSRGSVIPLFLKQKETGTLTITDEKMTRFWITLEQGVKFVINSINNMKGGEIFVPKISSMKIMDLANAIAPESDKKIIGIRPGEKIHEILLTEDESKHSKEFDDFFVIEPEHPFWDKKNLVGGKRLSNGYNYTSENNDRWLSEKKLMEILKEM
jgi:FlaA1/EpsC-like NDP-sugar epimerase